jgi:hypothetical protein
LSYSKGKINILGTHSIADSTDEISTYIAQAHEVLDKLVEEYLKPGYGLADQLSLLTQETQQFKWFLFPSEALAEIQGKPQPYTPNTPNTSPFLPYSIPNSNSDTSTSTSITATSTTCPCTATRASPCCSSLGCGAEATEKERAVEAEVDEKKEVQQNGNAENNAESIVDTLPHDEDKELFDEHKQKPVRARGIKPLRIPKKEILTPVRMAIHEYNMIQVELYSLSM